jgi:DNA-binding transcriptional regulator YiaG
VSDAVTNTQLAVILGLTVQDVHAWENCDIELIASPDTLIGQSVDAPPANINGRQCFIATAALDR